MDIDTLKVAAVYEVPGMKFEEVIYTKLKGSEDLNVAEKIFFCNQAEIRLKMIRVTIQNKTLRIEPGALYFMKGQLDLDSSIPGGFGRGMLRKFMTGETLFQSTIKGTGEIYLEPTFGHFSIFELDNDSLIVDKGAFYAASDGIQVSAKMQSNISSAVFGGEGLFQTEIKGSGIVVVRSPVPTDELLVMELADGEKLSIDGNFALARTSTVKFAAQKSAKSLFTTVTSGELLLQTFTGPGIVWLAPTQGVYDKIHAASQFSALNAAKGTAGTNT